MTGNGQDLNEAEILKFVDAYIDSFIVWDIILYYFHNPTATETVASLAYRLGRPDQDTRQCLTKLVDKKVLLANDGGEYKYKPAPEVAKCIDTFNRALAVSTLRLAILSQVLSRSNLRPTKLS
jgi:DNA-binding IclR family transcriptional regulator